MYAPNEMNAAFPAEDMFGTVSTEYKMGCQLSPQRRLLIEEFGDKYRISTMKFPEFIVFTGIEILSNY
jgi:hypothetical protein